MLYNIQSYKNASADEDIILIAEEGMEDYFKSAGRMKQGEIWNVNLNPTKGSEQAGFRPVVIISGNLLNRYLNIVIVAPLTAKIKITKETRSSFRIKRMV